jgi:hypothetical protein
MRTRSAGAVLVCVVATAFVISACSDMGVTAPAAPVAPAQSSSNLLGLGGLLGLQQIAPITRNTPLAQDVSWSFTVGSGGATSSNSAVGLTIHVPYGAVSSPTTITVTALQGNLVAYSFAPHGLQFARRVTLTQKLHGTSVANQLLPMLSGAYFASDEPLLSGGLALVSEVLSGLLNPLLKQFSFPIEHFSGYLVASGRSRPSEEGME